MTTETQEKIGAEHRINPTSCDTPDPAEQNLDSSSIRNETHKNFPSATGIGRRLSTDDQVSTLSTEGNEDCKNQPADQADLGLTLPQLTIGTTASNSNYHREIVTAEQWVESGAEGEARIVTGETTPVRVRKDRGKQPDIFRQPTPADQALSSKLPPNAAGASSPSEMVSGLEISTGEPIATPSTKPDRPQRKNGRRARKGLSPRQQTFLAAYEVSPFIGSSARASGIHRSTVHVWQGNPQFVAAMEAAERRAVDALVSHTLRRSRNSLHTRSEIDRPVAATTRVQRGGRMIEGQPPTIAPEAVG